MRMSRGLQLIFKGQARKYVLLFRNYWWVLVIYGFLAVGIIEKISEIQKVLLKYNEGAQCVLAVGMLLLFLGKRMPMLRMEPATLLFLDKTKYSKSILRMKTVVAVIVSGALAFFFIWMTCGTVPFFACFHLFSLLISLESMLWRKYHCPEKTVRLFLCLLFLQVVYVLDIHYLGIFLNVAGILFAMYRKVPMARLKYFADMKYIFYCANSAIYKDNANMLEIVDRNKSKTTYRLSMNSFSVRYPLVLKSILVDVFRKNVFETVLHCVVCVTAILCYRYIRDDFVRRMIVLVLWMYLLNSSILMAIQSMRNMRDKEKRGLSLPYKKIVLPLAYLLYPCAFLLICNLLFFVFTGIPFWTFLGLEVGSVLITTVWICLADKMERYRMGLDIAMGIGVFLLSFFLSR